MIFVFSINQKSWCPACGYLLEIPLHDNPIIYKCEHCERNWNITELDEKATPSNHNQIMDDFRFGRKIYTNNPNPGFPVGHVPVSGYYSGHSGYSGYSGLLGFSGTTSWTIPTSILASGMIPDNYVFMNNFDTQVISPDRATFISTVKKSFRKFKYKLFSKLPRIEIRIGKD